MVTSKSKIHINDPILRRAMYEVFDGKCFYTGRAIMFNDIHIDHIVPKSIGGEDCIENYVLCSQYINLKKNDRIDGWRIEIIKETNLALFSHKVVKVYNYIYYNEICINESIELREYFKNTKVSQEIRSKISSRLNASKNIFSIKMDRIVDGKVSKRKRIFYKIQDIEKVINEYI